MTAEIAAHLDAILNKTWFRSTFKINFKRKIASGKIAKICWQITIAAWKQPFQYDSQCELQKTIVLHAQPRHQATLTQSLHCDLQPRMQRAHRSTHTWTTTRCRTPRENWFDDETSAAAPAAHTRYFSAPAEAPLHRKNTRFRAPATSPKQTPCNIHAAMTLRFAASRGKHASLYAHDNKTWHQSCRHHTAICNHFP